MSDQSTEGLSAIERTYSLGAAIEHAVVEAPPKTKTDSTQVTLDEL